MNILLIIPIEYKGERWGGVMTYTLSLAAELQKSGHTVAILSPGTKNERFLDGGIYISKIAYYQIHIPIFSRLGKYFPQLIDRILWMIGVYAYIKKHNHIDIIECAEWGSSALLWCLTGKRNVVVRLHKSLLQHYQDNAAPITTERALINYLELLSIFFSGGITSPTDYMLRSHKQIIRVKKIFNTPIALIPNGTCLPPTLLSEHVKQEYILTVGRLEKAKGQLVLISAFAKIAKRFPHINLTIIGRDTNNEAKIKGGYKRILELTASRLKISKRVLIINQIPQSQLFSYYRDSLVYVTPSQGHENHPLALLDAVAWGKAVIGSNTGGIPEIIIDHINGLLFKTNDVEHLASTLAYVIKNKQMRTQYEHYNIENREKYDIKIMAKKTIQFYENIVLNTIKG